MTQRMRLLRQAQLVACLRAGLSNKKRRDVAVTSALASLPAAAASAAVSGQWMTSLFADQRLVC